MNIANIETVTLKDPFSDGSPGTGLFPSAWTDLDFVLVKITDDS